MYLCVPVCVRERMNVFVTEWVCIFLCLQVCVRNLCVAKLSSKLSSFFGDFMAYVTMGDDDGSILGVVH